MGNCGLDLWLGLERFLGVVHLGFEREDGWEKFLGGVLGFEVHYLLIYMIFLRG